ncbi:MAG: PASTA domain-containing protein, partial [Candidatus Binatia bacterium]
IVEREPEQANRLLRTAGLEPLFVEDEPSDTVADGLVSRQDPPAGRSVARGSQIRYWVSSGRQVVRAPDIRGMKLEDAARRLQEEGLRLGRRTPEFSTEEAGVILSQNPRAGTEVRKGDDIEVVYSQGEERAVVPDVIGQQEADASAILANAGFRVNRIRETHPSAERGRVFDQDPQPQAEAAPGSVVNIFISEGPETFPMPNVIGDTEESATEELEAMGLVVQTERRFTPDASQRGRVIDQSPDPDTTVRRGDRVTISIGSSS